MLNRIKIILSLDFFEGILIFLFKCLPTYLYVKYLGKHETVWLFSERQGDARDNAFVLYKWISHNHPDQKLVYAINHKSVDYIKVRSVGKIVKYGSYHHWYYYFASKICCGTTWNCCLPNDMVFLMTRHLLPTKAKRVFLQHGITKDYMPEMTYKKLVADILVCGAYPEYEYINKEFGYPDGHVKYIGFARFDKLVDKSSTPRILYMPTWRKWIKDSHKLKISEYYYRITSLLSSPKLLMFLEKNNIELIFFIHPTRRSWKKYFARFSSEKIKILNNEDVDLQELICSSNLFITDYSSVYFDFAYQNKPVIYYHFDYLRYRNSHFSEGYFSYSDDGFGPIVETEDQLINEMISIAHNQWNSSDCYQERRDRFFPLKDYENCKRHYELLKQL